MTDGKGRTVSFAECIIILTSNSGVTEDLETNRKIIGLNVRNQETSGRDVYEQQIAERATKYFRPELLNRISHRVIFYPLTREAVFEILDNLLAQLNDMLSEKTITVTMEEGARNHLLELGYSETYGAREMGRIFEQHVTKQLGQKLIDGTILPGTSVIIKILDGTLQVSQ